MPRHRTRRATGNCGTGLPPSATERPYVLNARLLSPTKAGVRLPALRRAACTLRLPGDRGPDRQRQRRCVTRIHIAAHTLTGCPRNVVCAELAIHFRPPRPAPRDPPARASPRDSPPPAMGPRVAPETARPASRVSRRAYSRSAQPSDPALLTDLRDRAGRSEIGGARWIPSCAETAHAPVRLLAGSLLTLGPKRKSAALGGGFRSVADRGVSVRFPLLLAATPEQKPADP